MNARFYEFFYDAVAHLTVNGTHVHLSPDEFVDGCSGSYQAGDSDVEGGELHLAMGFGNRWPEIFIHEYCHFLQQLDQDGGIEVAYVPVSADETNVMWAQIAEVTWLNRLGAWFTGGPGSPLLALRKTRAMEVDCDRRAIELIRKHRLPIDLVRYAQQANAYHLFYTVMETTRRWYDHAPCSAIIARMPTTLLTDWAVDPELLSLFVERCYDA